jgi:hypothetical protein
MVATSLLRATRRAAAPLRRTGPRAFSSASAERERLVVFDTTLRDGEQSPGATMTGEEKVSIAKSLSRLGVDVCEAGFPIASNGDFEAVKAVAETAGHLTEGRDPASKTMRIAGLSRANEKDIARCYDAVRHAPLHRVHTFIASSEIHLKHKLNITRAQCLETAAAMVAFARGLSSTPAGLDEAYDIEFSAEDSGRSDPDFLVELCTAVIEAGATTINLPDTVGYMVPEEYGSLFACAAHFGAIFGATRPPQRRAAPPRKFFSSSHPRRAQVPDREHRDARQADRVVDALPQRPRPRHRQLARRGAAGRAADRGDAQRHRRARGEHVARGVRDGAAHAAGALPRLLRHRHQDDHEGVEAGAQLFGAIRAQFGGSPRPSGVRNFPTRPSRALRRSRRTPGSPSRRTRRSSAPTPSPTSRGSTSTACSSTPRRTRS